MFVFVVLLIGITPLLAEHRGGRTAIISEFTVPFFRRSADSSSGTPWLRGSQRRLALVAAETAFICDFCAATNADTVLSEWYCDNLCNGAGDYGKNYCHQSFFHGIICSSESIRELLLSESSITGTIPTSIGELTNLVTAGTDNERYYFCLTTYFNRY